MPKPEPREVTGKPENHDRERLAAIRRMAELASEHADEIVTTALEVMRDKTSRQRLAAGAFLTELMNGQVGKVGPVGGGTKVLVINTDQMKRMEEMQRAANQQRMIEAKVIK